MALFGPNDLVEFQKSGARVLTMMQQLGKTMTYREQLFLEMGMRSSHIEEAMAHGELGRAKSHIDQLTHILGRV